MRNIDHSPLNIDHSPLAIDHWLRRCWLQLALFTVTCSLFTSPAQAQTIGDAFYVYTKDGNISTFRHRLPKKAPLPIVFSFWDRRISVSEVA